MFQKERAEFNFLTPPWIKQEHLARFHFAAGYVKDKIIVDCACGEGIGAENFFTANAKKIYAFDSSARSIQKAKAKGLGDRICFEVATALKLPLEADSADVFISLETIEHISEDRTFLKEVVRVLKDSGVFICSTPNRRVTNPGLPSNGKPWNRFHVREYSSGEFQELLRSYFSHIKIYGQNPQSHLRTQIFDQIGNCTMPSTAVLLRQTMKFPLWFFDKAEKHQVQPADHEYDYEYMIAVCPTPRRGT